MVDVAVIAIGRNEGERLRLCLRSVAGRGFPVVYVDSGSTDGSVEVARSLGADVVSLDLSKPFSAARARNEGFDRLLHASPGVAFVQFVDGDCEVVAGWLERARAELVAKPEAAVVCGRRRERFPEASIYNRLADLEWDRPAGEVQSCGGDAMYRVEAFRAIGGFDATVAAGEEPELCARLRERGFVVLRVDAEMTLHDAATTRFGQWWRRQVRSGYGAMDVATRFGSRGLFVDQVRRAGRWTVGWLMAVALTFGLLLVFVGLVAGLVGAAIVALAWPAQVIRLTLQMRRRLGWRDAFAYGALTMIGKWANFVGQIQYRRDRATGRNTRLIEYKAAPTAPAATDR